MKSLFFALALVCSGPEHRCIMFEGPTSPHETKETCEAELKEQLATLSPADMQRLHDTGGYFNSGCFAFGEGVQPKDHVEDLEKMLDKPKRFYGPPVPKVDG